MSFVWHLVPITAAVSLVYGASRYESPEWIVRCALQVFLQIAVGFAVILVGLFVLSWRL